MDDLIATFTRRDEADRAAARLRAEMPEAVLAVGEREDVLDALAVNQRAELGDPAMSQTSATFSGPMLALWSGPMMRGAVVGAVLGFLVGAVLALPLLLLVDWPENERGVFVISVAVIGGLALSSATVIIGAVRRAQKEGEFTPEDPWAVVRVTPPQGGHDEVAALLGDAGARSIQRLQRPVQRHRTDDVETPRRSTERAPADDWPASQRGARSG